MAGGSAATHGVDATGGGKHSYLRLGAYQDAEDGYIEKSISAGDGIFLMTTAQLTADVAGTFYVEANDGMSLTGTETVTITDAGQTSIRAKTIGMAAGRGPVSSGDDIHFDADGDVTFESGEGIDVTCSQFIYVMDQTFKWSGKEKGFAQQLEDLSVTLGGKFGMYVGNNSDISGSRWEPRIWDWKFALFDTGLVVFKGSQQVAEIDQTLSGSFWSGLWGSQKHAKVDAKAVKADTNAVKSDMPVVRVRAKSADSGITGTAKARARGLSFN